MFNKIKKQSLISTSKLTGNHGTEFKDYNYLNLSSPAPFKNELKKFNIFYAILSIIFIISFKKDVGSIISILMGICASFLIINIIAAFKVDKLRATAFTLPVLMPKDQIIDLITLPLTQLNMKVENLKHYIRITHNKMQYDIIIYPDKNTFIIWPQKTLLSRLFSRIHTKLYKNAIISMPIISYTIQNEINKFVKKSEI
ncbi:hypothetical protein N4T77_12580 [Clostridium sp. CX1]|uniref:hypothetical protein n=1 Tax=Clostridium sp. CX1 TaxID=2978346 RepID=UPI0021C215A3|nr:hypothetical protein [Clostridium sp. CX1]MCT8977439.1 hypothetical protein [Clostridium sp. CX1]